MKSKPYPMVPNTIFRSIPKTALNLASDFEWPLHKVPDDIFHGYALTNTREIWYGRGVSWRKVDLSKDHKGIPTVVLRFFGQEGQTVIPFNLLYEHVFGE